MDVCYQFRVPRNLRIDINISLKLSLFTCSLFCFICFRFYTLLIFIICLKLSLFPCNACTCGLSTLLKIMGSPWKEGIVRLEVDKVNLYFQSNGKSKK